MNEEQTIDDLNTPDLAENIPAEDSAPLLNSSDFIDATQNAIVGVAENVSEALTLTEKSEPSEHQVYFYQDAEFWVGMSFVVVVIMIAKPSWKAIKGILQKNAETIVSKIEEAAKIRDDAQKLLAEYMAKCANLKQRITQIAEQSRTNIETYRKQELKNLQKNLDKKEKEVLIRINRTTQAARDEINASITDRAVYLAQKTIEKHLSEDDKNRLIDNAISELDKIKL